MTGAGTYLLPFLKMDKVVEYDKDLKEIWSYTIQTPWAAVRLHNGNTLITDERDRLIREVNPKGETVWEFRPCGSARPTSRFRNTQTADRLVNGNTVIFSSTGGTKAEERTEADPDGRGHARQEGRVGPAGLEESRPRHHRAVPGPARASPNARAICSVEETPRSGRRRVCDAGPAPASGQPARGSSRPLELVRVAGVAVGGKDALIDGSRVRARARARVDREHAWRGRRPRGRRCRSARRRASSGSRDEQRPAVEGAGLAHAMAALAAVLAVDRVAVEPRRRRRTRRPPVSPWRGRGGDVGAGRVAGCALSATAAGDRGQGGEREQRAHQRPRWLGGHRDAVDRPRRRSRARRGARGRRGAAGTARSG